MRKGIFGGTFDYLHDGHRALISTASREGDKVLIGVTSDEIANQGRERTVKPFEERKQQVVEECKTFGNINDCEFEIVKIEDPLTLAVESDADFIVLSPEDKTHERASKINRKRVEEGKERLQIIEAPMVHDYKGRKISATYIHQGEIDEHGQEV